MNYKVKKLSNGIRVLTVPMKSSESFTLTVWVKTGSRNEEKKIGGISHFLEHMVFKGSSKRPSAREISTEVDSIGGEFNAATSKDWTNFYIKARNTHIEKAFDVLSDMVINPVLDPNEIEREKGTIIQEIAMYEDMPMMKVGEVFEEVIFDGNSLSWDTIGTPESVKSLNRDDFERYRNIHYYPENILITVAGGVSESAAIDLAKKYFGEVKSPPSGRAGQKVKGKNIGQNFKTGQSGPQAKIEYKKSDQAHFIIGFMGDPRNYKNKYIQSVLLAVLDGGMSARLFTEVRERRGLAYAIKSGFQRYQDTGYISTYIGTDPKKVEEAVSVVLQQYYGISNGQFPISNEEMKKAKEYIKGHLALALEETSDVGSFFGEQELFLGKAMTPEEVFEAIDRVTIKEIYAESKRLFVPSRLNLAAIGPFKAAKKFVKLLK